MSGIHKNICESCGRSSYPCHARCPSCGGTAFAAKDFEDTAKLLTFTRVHALSLAYTDLFITLGIVEFADGTRALARLDVEEPEIGMELRAKIGIVRSDGLTDTEGLRLIPA